jgi:hypothetical protein
MNTEGTAMTTASVLDRTASDFRPGFLLQPLGWLNQKLANTHGLNRDLLAGLLELGPWRMHLIATVVALGDDESACQMVKLLLRGSGQNITSKILGRYPPGLSRALKSLPHAVMPAESYRQLVELLDDSGTAKFLHHRCSIDKSLIAALSALPPVLRRPAIFELNEQKLGGMDRFVQGLRFLSMRAGLSLDSVMRELGALDQVEQVIAKIVELAEGVPLPDTLPKCAVGPFRRMDGVAEIRSLAKAWQNCLADYLHVVNDGTCAIYLCSHGSPPAVAFVSRFDRLGWALDQIKGPKNAGIGSIHELAYRKAFMDAGIPSMSDVTSIKDLIVRKRWTRSGQ